MTDLHRPLRTQDDLATFWLDEEGLHLLDQRALPGEERILLLTTVEAVAEAIETLAVRGAPAIGGAAALALALLVRTCDDDEATVRRLLEEADARLRRTRPTAVNLFYALDAVRAAAAAAEGRDELRHAVVDAAEAYLQADAAACERMAEHGAALFEDGDRVLTICHTGALATCGIGTALGVLKAAHRAGKRIEVVALETRPLLQGARLTAWECLRVGLPVTLITDGMAAFALARRGITRAIVGADRIAANGDTANKIGTYGLASLCRAHGGVPCYVAAPTSTFDATVPTGDDIPIEERNPLEIIEPRGTPFAPAEVPVWNPAFDVTPSGLLAGIITERGVWRPPFTSADRDALLAPRPAGGAVAG